MKKELLWLHFDEAGKPLRRYSRLREIARVIGVIFMSLFTMVSLWCFIVLVDLVMA